MARQVGTPARGIIHECHVATHIALGQEQRGPYRLGPLVDQRIPLPLPGSPPYPRAASRRRLEERGRTAVQGFARSGINEGSQYPAIKVTD